jgi:hypothetical protein
MKKIQFVVLCLTLVMAPFLSSCLNSTSNDTTQTSYGFARVVSYMGSYWLINDSGEKLVPTSASLASIVSNGLDLSKIDRAYIGYQLLDESQVTSQASLPASSRAYDVALEYVANIDHPVATVVKGTANDTIKSDPIYSLSPWTTDVNILLSNGYLTFAPNYYLYNRKHYFTLFNYSDESFKAAGDAAAPDTLNLHLSHNINSDAITSGYLSSAWASQYPSVFFMSFNINNILAGLSTTKSNIIINVNIKENQGTSTVSNKVYSTKYEF